MGTICFVLLRNALNLGLCVQEIRPYETKPIIKLNFFGRSINNHTAFIRIKTNSSLEDSPIALPVEVKVTPGYYYQYINYVIDDNFCSQPLGYFYHESLLTLGC